MKFASFLRLVRFPNLIIVGLTEYLMRYCVLEPYYQQHGVAPTLDSFEFFILVLATIVIAAAGYIVNDIYDVEIDQINKPDKAFIPRVFSLKMAWWMYAILNAFGLAISVYLANRVGQLPLILLFPLFAVPLWLYSWRLKKMPLIGNVMISFFCAAVALLVIYAERQAYYQVVIQSLESGKAIFYFFVGYANFAFYSTMLREIVKDIEDVQGDTAEDCRTLPIVWGVQRAKQLAILFGIVLTGFLLFLIYWQFSYWPNMSMGAVYLIVFVIFPILYVVRNIWRATEKTEFHRISQVAKFIMLAGLLYLPFIYFLSF